MTGSADSVHVHRGVDGQWYYTSKAANGQSLSTSEGYTRREDAVRAASAEHPGVTVTG